MRPSRRLYRLQHDSNVEACVLHHRALGGGIGVALSVQNPDVGQPLGQGACMTSPCFALIRRPLLVPLGSMTALKACPICPERPHVCPVAALTIVRQNGSLAVVKRLGNNAVKPNFLQADLLIWCDSLSHSSNETSLRPCTDKFIVC